MTLRRSTPPFIASCAVAILASSCGSGDAPSDVADAAAGDDAIGSDGAVTETSDSAPPPDAPPSDAPVDAGCGGDRASFTPAWARAAAPSKELYVSPTGDDGNDGSAGKPLKTAAKAASMIAPGVRINFAAGTYGCSVVVSNVMATSATPVVIRSSDGPRAAKFDCGGTSDFFFSHVSFVVLDGLEISHTSGHGVQLDSGATFDPSSLSSDFVLENSYVHDTALASIKVAQSRRVTVVGNEFARSGPGRQDVEFVAVDDGVIALNDAHDSDAFDEVKGGARGGLIVRNRVHDMNAGGGGILVGGDCTGKPFLVDPTVDFEAQGLKVWGNVVTGADGFAFRIVGCHDCLVASNSYWSPAPKAILRVLHDSFASAGGGSCDIPLHNLNLHIVDNLFAWPSASTYVIASDEDAANVKLDHNLWFAIGGDVSKLGADLPFLGESSSIYADPKLSAPPADLTLGAGSPATGAGIALPDVPTDANGKCWGASRDIGAY